MLIIASKPGQLGNRLFLFAQFIGCARDHNVALTNAGFDEYAPYFQTTSRDLLCRYPARPSSLPKGRLARKLFYQICYYAARALVRSGIKSETLRAVSLDWEEELRLDDPGFLATLKPRQLVLMQGWLFRDEPAVARHAGAIREYFRPRDEFRANVAALIQRARESCDVLVGVHIRHGDYRTYKGGKYFYELETYAAQLERVQSLWPERRVAFLICSNAEQDKSFLSRFPHLSGTGHLIEDMYALAACDYLIGPPSTYTMWASFYGEVPLHMIEDPRRAPTLADFQTYGLGKIDAPQAESAPPSVERESRAAAL
ncbi:MAG TPA: hypothetical protein VNA19_01395 [Pyrinomonadaceae bacterium]|nr:hypothetical protein [Pyrinomonadaceae bacterium]